MADAGQARKGSAEPGQGSTEESRLRRAGEAADTRFGMAEGERSDMPETGEGLREANAQAEDSERTPERV